MEIENIVVDGDISENGMIVVRKNLRIFIMESSTHDLLTGTGIQVGMQLFQLYTAPKLLPNTARTTQDWIDLYMKNEATYDTSTIGHAMVWLFTFCVQRAVKTNLYGDTG